MLEVSDERERCAGADRPAQRRASPQHGASPEWWTFVGEALAAGGGVQPVRSDQKGPLDGDGSVRPSILERGGDRVGRLLVREQPVGLDDAVGSATFAHGIEKEHLQFTAVHGELRPAVAGVSTPRLGPDVVAITADQRPLLGLDPDVGEPVGESEIGEFPNRVGLEVDPDP